MKFTTAAAFLGLTSGVCAFPSEVLGKLNAEDAAKLEAVRRNPQAAYDLIGAHKRQDQGEKGAAGLVGPLVDGILDLPLGGGLLDGILQPLSGPLAKLGVPTPQPAGREIVPDKDHPFIAPGPTDQRGICPTLNALANHGYLSRDGITTFAEAANAVQIAYGASYDLSVFLSAVGLLAGGDLLTGKYSIGGADDRVPNTLGPALGLDKHGVFEIDGSITREDVHFGNNANFIQQRWDEYENFANTVGKGQFNAEANAADNGFRYDNSRNTNPEFFAGAIWFIVSHAERVFVYELMANGTETGAGDASYENIAPFFLNETFPKDWYRQGVPFSLPAALASGGQMFLSNPRELGENNGVGNFVPLSTNLTEFKPDQLGCFLVHNIFDLAPNQLQTTVADNFDLYQSFAKGVIAPFFSKAGSNGAFDCENVEWVKPSVNAGVNGEKSQPAAGSPVNGKYPGIGEVKPDSQPSK